MWVNIAMHKEDSMHPLLPTIHTGSVEASDSTILYTITMVNRSPYMEK